MLEKSLLCTFASCYYKKNDQFAILEEVNSDDILDYCDVKFPKSITLENSRELMVRRNQRIFLKYFTPNKCLNPKRFADQHLLFFFAA